MMTDRELLESAAKAAGVHLHHWNDALDRYMASTVEGGDPDYGWNPLTDDGDALRLAVKLGLAIYPAGTGTGCAPEGDETGQHVMHNGDPLKATRRAIVRAAAAIGETK